MNQLSIYVRSVLLVLCGVIGGLFVDRNLGSEYPIYTVVMSIGGVLLGFAFFKSQTNNNSDEF